MKLHRLVALALSFAVALALTLQAAGALADPPRRAAAHAPASNAASSEGVVNINTASADELTRLPGVGPSRADAIVRLRERVRRFSHVEDLRRVRGIGRVTLQRMRPYLALQGDTTLAARPGRSPRAPRAASAPAAAPATATTASP
ncbi:MAG: helix-hairpin-helix domain-containing protein [Polyangiales bacterium]